MSTSSLSNNLTPPHWGQLATGLDTQPRQPVGIEGCSATAWNWCPKDGQRFDPNWKYCPMCGMERGRLPK